MKDKAIDSLVRASSSGRVSIHSLKKIRPDKEGKHTICWDSPEPYYREIELLSRKEGRTTYGQLAWLIMETLRARGIRVLEPELAVLAQREGRSGLMEEDPANG